jgi:alkyldihydroxyacetonephosphate synthase
MGEHRKIKDSRLENIPWGHKWGFKDTEFFIHDDRSVELRGKRYMLSGYKMHDFLPYVEKVLGMKMDLENLKLERTDKPVDPPRKNENFCKGVADTFRSDQISFDDEVRLLHSHGQTTAEEVYRVLYDRLERFADMVFFCESQEDAEKIVALAEEHDVCLVPYGGGTSVSCALQLPPEEKRMIVSIDMLRMNKVEWIDRKNMMACVQAGIWGMDLEALMNEEGFTIGHEPDSIELSTLGGWIATNASGMKKNKYGNIEQCVENITLVTARGVIEQKQPLCRAAVGTQPQLALFGNEGNFGIITRAVIKLFPIPEVTKYGSLVFPDFMTGASFLEELSKTDYIPASIRLVDNIQFKFGLALKETTDSKLEEIKSSLQKFFLFSIKKFDPDQMVAATIVMEGSKEQVTRQEKCLYKLAKKYRGIPGGAEAGQRGYLLTYAIAYIRDFVVTFDVIGETFETSVPWSKVQDVTRAVEERAAVKHKELGFPGDFYVSYRITQVYHTGCCIYFMLGLLVKGLENPADTFGKMEHSLREAILEAGGSVSHHHGVGKLRKDFMKDTFSEGTIEFIKQMKKGIDPKNIFGIKNNALAE